MARLDRLLANLGYGSRREVTDLVARRQVVLDGAVLKDSGARIPVTADLPERMTVAGPAAGSACAADHIDAQAGGGGLLASRARPQRL